MRPTNGRAEDPERRSHAIQYFAYPDWKFERLRRETPGRYEAGANIGLNEWLRLRLVVDGGQVQVYLDRLGNDEPLLSVHDLKLGANARGAIGLFVDIGSERYFSNLKIVHRNRNSTSE